MKQHKPKILIVEDNECDQKMFERYIRSSYFPFDYQFAKSVSEAKQYISSDRFDIAIVDYKLGDGTAFDLFKYTADIPFILMSGAGNEEIAVKAMKAGAYDYLVKDLDGNYLKTITIFINSAIKRKKAEDELANYRKRITDLVQIRTADLRKEIAVRKKTEKALNNALKEANQRNDEISALLKGSRTVSEKRDFNDATSTILNICQQLLHVEYCGINLIDFNTNENDHVLLNSGLTDRLFNENLHPFILKICDKVFSSCRTVYENNISQPATIKNLLFAPLIIAGRAVGFIGLFNKTKYFTQNDALMTKAFAELIAIKLINSKSMEALQKSEERFHSLYEFMTEGVALYELVYDELNTVVNYRTIDINPAFESIMGVERRNVLNKLATDIYSDAKIPFLDICSYVARTGKPTLFEMYFKRINKYLKVSAFSPGKDKIATVFSDITEQKMAEENLRKLNEDLKRSNEELEEFTYVVSHDLKEPLRKISSFGEFLLEDYSAKLDGDGVNYIKRMQDAAVRMKNLITDLLEISRVGIRGEKLKVTDPNKIVDEILKLMQFSKVSSKRKYVTVYTDNYGNKVILYQLPKVMADPVQLQHVFQNLVNNGIKFHKPDKTAEVSIRAQKNKKWVTFIVKDNGIGIETRFLKKIFVIFQRLHLRESYSGTGVGLALSKKIVERHSGQIWCESKIGKGSKFYFTIQKG